MLNCYKVVYLGEEKEWKKHLIVLGIAVLLICVGLSGCEESDKNNDVDVTGDTSEIELLGYNITTTWWVVVYGGSEKYEKSGFYHGYPSDAFNKQYKISGTVKNIAGKTLDKVNITANFYDSNNNFLASKTDSKNIFIDTYTWDFEIICSSINEYFEEIDHLKFEFEVS